VAVVAVVAVAVVAVVAQCRRSFAGVALTPTARHGMQHRARRELAALKAEVEREAMAAAALTAPLDDDDDEAEAVGGAAGPRRPEEGGRGAFTPEPGVAAEEEEGEEEEQEYVAHVRGAICAIYEQVRGRHSGWCGGAGRGGGSSPAWIEPLCTQLPRHGDPIELIVVAWGRTHAGGSDLSGARARARQHAPERLRTVELLLRQWRGEEEELLAQVQAKYLRPVGTNGCVIEAPWLVHGGHGASLRQPQPGPPAADGGGGGSRLGSALLAKRSAAAAAAASAAAAAAPGTPSPHHASPARPVEAAAQPAATAAEAAESWGRDGARGWAPGGEEQQHGGLATRASLDSDTMSELTDTDTCATPSPPL
jgi:hypothetical protein